MDCLITDETVQRSYPIIDSFCLDDITHTTMMVKTDSSAAISYRSFAFSASQLMEHEETLTCKVIFSSHNFGQINFWLTFWSASVKHPV